MRAGGGDVPGDLEAELAGRDDDQRLRARRRRPRPAAKTRSSSGMPKPRVLPVPVGAWPIRSVPRSAIGSAYSWMAKARVMPTAASASTVSARAPSSAKVGLRGGPGAVGGQCFAGRVLDQIAHVVVGVPSRGAPRHVRRARSVWRGPHATDASRGPHARRGAGVTDASRPPRPVRTLLLPMRRCCVTGAYASRGVGHRVGHAVARARSCPTSAGRRHRRGGRPARHARLRRAARLRPDGGRRPARPGPAPTGRC